MMRSRDRAEPATALERLNARAERVLRDELRHGCADRLVQGGLETFVRYWADEVKRAVPVTSARVGAEAAAAALRGYRLLPPDERELALQLALGHLASSPPPATGAAAPELPPPTVQPSRAAPVASRPVVAARGPRPTVRVPLDASLEELSGVGPARSRALARLGLRTYGDLLNHFPARYEHYPPPRPASELLFVQKASYVGAVQDVQVSTSRAPCGRPPFGLPTRPARCWRPGCAAARPVRSRPRTAPGGQRPGPGVWTPGGVRKSGLEPADSAAVHTRGIVPVSRLPPASRCTGCATGFTRRSGRNAAPGRLHPNSFAPAARPPRARGGDGAGPFRAERRGA